MGGLCPAGVCGSRVPATTELKPRVFMQRACQCIDRRLLYRAERDARFCKTARLPDWEYRPKKGAHSPGAISQPHRRMPPTVAAPPDQAPYRQESGEKLHAGLNIRDRCDVTLPGRRSSPRPVSSGGVVPAMVPLPDGTLFRHKRISVRRDGAGTTHFAMLDSLVKIKPPPVTGAV